MATTIRLVIADEFPGMGFFWREVGSILPVGSQVALPTHVTAECATVLPNEFRHYGDRNGDLITFEAGISEGLDFFEDLNGLDRTIAASAFISEGWKLGHEAYSRTVEKESDYRRAQIEEGDARELAAFLLAGRESGGTHWYSPPISRGSRIDEIINKYEHYR